MNSKQVDLVVKEFKIIERAYTGNGRTIPFKESHEERAIKLLIKVEANK